MYEYSVEKIGTVTNLTVTRDSDNPDIFILKFQPSTTDIMNVPMTELVARQLWFYLTKFLFPGAAPQLTSRAETAGVVPPSSMSVAFTVMIVERKDQMIEVVMASATGGWSMHFSRDDGADLWASLEHLLRPADSKNKKQLQRFQSVMNNIPHK
jgi:hypothetical protein